MLLNFFQIAQCAANQLALTTRCGMCEMWSLTLSCHTRNQSCNYGATSQSTALRKLTFHIAHSPCELSDTWNLRHIGSSPSLRTSVTNTTNWVMRMTRERSGEPPLLKDCFQIDQYASELINSFHQHLNVFFLKVVWHHTHASFLHASVTFFAFRFLFDRKKRWAEAEDLYTVHTKLHRILRKTNHCSVFLGF